MPLSKGNLDAKVLFSSIWGVTPEGRLILVPRVSCIFWSSPHSGSGSLTLGIVRLLRTAVLRACGWPPEGHEHPWVPSEV